MDSIYGVVGVIARVMERTSRTRGNGIPLSWLMLIFVAMLTTAAGVMLTESIRNQGPPTLASVAQVLDAGMKDVHVTLRGQFATDHAMVQSDFGNDKDIKAIYVPLVDGGRAIYVQLQNTPQDQAIAAGDHVTGMVRPVDKDLKDDMDSTQPMVGTALVDEHYYLKANEAPANLLIWAPLTALGALLSLVMLLTITLRYVVFRPAPVDSPVTPISRTSAPPPDGAAMQPLRASGVFVFNERPKERKRFLSVPATLAEMASGDKGLVTNVDASASFMGRVTKNLAGLWSIVIKKRSVSDVRDGWQYVGFKPLPAIRFRHVDATSGKTNQTVISFATEADRQLFRQRLIF
jgi:hypothetical protein